MENIEITIQQKESIIAEYMIGGISYRKLQKKYGVDFRTINLWVRRYQGKLVKKEKPGKTPAPPNPEEFLPTDVKQLQEELRKARLHNKLLNAMIDIAEDQLKIDIRKKSGTKR